MKQIKNTVLMASLLFGLSLVSCDDFFNPGAADLAEEEPSYENLAELRGGYWGIAAAVASIADQAIFLEGLRGDLLEPTQNATNDILDLYYYKEDGRNEFADPVGYYKIVLIANNFLSNAVRFYKENPNAAGDKATFDAMLSEAVRYKAWAYLMLAKIYGEAVWMDEPLAEYDDIQRAPLKFDELILKCIDLIENGTTVNGYKVDGKSWVRWTDVLGDSDLQWNRLCPTADCLLAELYLFAGQYQKVIDHGFEVLWSGEADRFDRPSFQITSNDYNGSWTRLFGLFSRFEHITLIPYDYQRGETNRLIDYFSNDPSSHYLMRPSEAAMDRFRNQITSGGGRGDQYRGDGRTFRLLDGEWTLYKHSNRFYPDELYRNEPIIPIYRAPDIHLMIAEALVQLGRLYEAVYLYDGGIESFFSETEGQFNDRVDPLTGETIAVLSDFPSCLWRQTNGDKNLGIRGRVGLRKLGEAYLRSNADQPLEYRQQGLDSLLVEETCLESAAEARAYYAMIRVAKRWNRPEIVADRVSAKYPEESREAMRSLLMNPENWFIKRKLE